MGSYIFLEIIPERIDSVEWEDVYDITLKLLRMHPTRLFG